MYNVPVLMSSSWLRGAVGIAGACAVFVMYLLQAILGFTIFFADRFIDEIVATEQMFLMMTNLYAFMCQFFFFTLCDITMLRVEHKHKSGRVISGLTTLLLYSIITYFLSRIQETFRHPSERSRSSTTTRNYVLKVLKVILEFAKAAIVVLCLREQGLQYQFDTFYSPVTFAYYVCTEKFFVDAIVKITRLFDCSSMDSLEHFYVPILLRIFTISTAFGITLYLLAMRNFMVYTILSSYFTLYLPVKDVLWNYVNPLMLEQKTFASFKVANDKDLSRWDDICAVCLEKMSKARITPCNHLFHPQCLKRCLQTSMQCPLCKSEFLEN